MSHIEALEEVIKLQKEKIRELELKVINFNNIYSPIIPNHTSTIYSPIIPNHTSTVIHNQPYNITCDTPIKPFIGGGGLTTISASPFQTSVGSSFVSVQNDPLLYQFANKA